MHVCFSLKKGKDVGLLIGRDFTCEAKLVTFIWVTCYFSLKFFQLKNTANEITQCSFARKRKQFVYV